MYCRVAVPWNGRQCWVLADVCSDVLVSLVSRCVDIVWTQFDVHSLDSTVSAWLTAAALGDWWRRRRLGNMLPPPPQTPPPQSSLDFCTELAFALSEVASFNSVPSTGGVRRVQHVLLKRCQRMSDSSATVSGLPKPLHGLLRLLKVHFVQHDVLRPRSLCTLCCRIGHLNSA